MNLIENENQKILYISINEVLFSFEINLNDLQIETEYLLDTQDDYEKISVLSNAKPNMHDEQCI